MPTVTHNTRSSVWNSGSELRWVSPSMWNRWDLAGSVRRSIVVRVALLWVAATLVQFPPAEAIASSSGMQAGFLSILERPGPALSFSKPLGVAVDTVGGLIIIADTGNNRIRIFDSGGYPIVSHPHRVDGPRGRTKGEPKALAVDREGTLYVLDALAQYVDVMDLLGNYLHQIHPIDIAPGSARETRIEETHTASEASPEDMDLTPVALTLDTQDRLVLAVGGMNSQIWGLDENWDVRWVLDGSERGATPFGSITDLFVDGEGRIYVTDGTREPAVRVFSKEREELLSFGSREVGGENFSFPASVVATVDGRIWVLDAIRQAVKVFDRDGNYLGLVGGKGQRDGEFLFPSRLATNGLDRLYVLERVGARLTTFQIEDRVVRPMKTRPGSQG